MNPTFATPRRRRQFYALAALLVVVLGLISRRHPELLPAAMGKYPGDTLWTVLVFLLWGIALPRATTLTIGALSLLTSYAVEFGQLYRAPWILEVRRTTLGHLVLGSGFAWGDLAAYTVGGLLAMAVEHRIFAAVQERQRPPVRPC